jgi:O-antigen ligase
VILALIYWLIALTRRTPEGIEENTYLWKWLIGTILVALLIIIPLYNTNVIFRTNTRFAFEGFFSLVEKGRWEVHSNNILMDMYIFPDNLKTWLIGDGYIENPTTIDPYYTGNDNNTFYKGTDVGYLRFIFYFGIFGLLAFIAFFIAITKDCMKKFPKQGILFLLFLAVNLIGWFKVSTDIFLVFAPFLLISGEENDEDLKRLRIPITLNP